MVRKYGIRRTAVGLLVLLSVATAAQAQTAGTALRASRFWAVRP